MPRSATLPASYRLTYSDWLRFPDDGRLYEILGGELFVSPTPSTRHQRISRNLQFLLELYLRREGRGELLPAPIGVRLSEEDVPEPDLVVILRENLGRIEELCVAGPPDLVVEVLSPGTAGRDLGIKRSLYERSGVPEYWIADPVAETVEALSLVSARYVRSGLFGHGDVADTLRSPLLEGLEIPLSEVFTALR